MTLILRRATDTDQDEIRRAIYQAWQWRDPWSEADFERHLTCRRPDSYVDDFGHRHGDVGFVGEITTDGGLEVVGAAWYRFFAYSDRRAGFYASDVPEVVVAVWEQARGLGLGRALMTRLIDHATETGLPGLSLHVSSDNTRAQHLYRALGFKIVGDADSHGPVMYRKTHH